jgi:hypothetical protein
MEPSTDTVVADGIGMPVDVCGDCARRREATGSGLRQSFTEYGHVACPTTPHNCN